jgi:hypothetical protein
MSELPPEDNRADGGQECGRCGDVVEDGRMVFPETTEGAALNLEAPEWIGRDCLSRLDRVLAGWNR